MKLVCINCPRGCHLEVEKIADKYVVTGNTCPRGETYAINEISNPLRTVTTTVKIISKKYERLPVITNKQVPKAKMMDVMKALKNTEVVAPIKYGDVIVEDVAGLGTDIIASKSIEE